MKERESVIQNIDIAHVHVKQPSSSEVHLGITAENFSNHFSAPDSITTEYWEMYEKTATIYNYPGTKFYFIDNQLDSYKITSGIFLVGNSSVGSYISVGSALDTVSPYLSNYLNANIIDNGVQTDMFLSIEFDPSTNIITKISIHSY